LPLTLFKETIRMFAYITVYNPIREELC